MSINSTTSNNNFQLISFQEGGDLIYQRVSDGYLNATVLCKAAGKLWSNYYKASNTQEFVNELSSVLQIGRTDLIRTIQGGKPELQGTWVHPDIAINLGQWLSPKFAVKVSQRIREWSVGKHSSQPEKFIPYHLRRHFLNMNNVPKGYFSVLQEMLSMFIGPLEMIGHILPSNKVPDISSGLMFPKYMKLRGINLKAKKYWHEYEDGRPPIFANAYDFQHLADFKNYIEQVWLPHHAPVYFKRCYPEGLLFLKKVLALKGYKTASKLSKVEVP